jgi:hypothetical protein
MGLILHVPALDTCAVYLSGSMFAWGTLGRTVLDLGGNARCERDFNILKNGILSVFIKLKLYKLYCRLQEKSLRIMRLKLQAPRIPNRSAKSRQRAYSYEAQLSCQEALVPTRIFGKAAGQGFKLFSQCKTILIVMSEAKETLFFVSKLSSGRSTQLRTAASPTSRGAPSRCRHRTYQGSSRYIGASTMLSSLGL